ncbi:putative acyltransferase family protein [Blattamonas nauphoetae]|uniref:Acyltransferase family protein n=1 Tax=Blattamonas nauphoetae TaxID=2049346 RepID=A0ABQ9XSD3_9EUKA|nr:putative acyltransferase family protein [Blattamonas nauphoetae]
METLTINEAQEEKRLLKPKRERQYSFDLLRILACYMVIQVHAGEFYYICPGFTICKDDGSVWAGLLGSFLRAAVPIFVMLTGYFVLPIKVGTATFLKKRCMRILLPYAFWCLAYASYDLIAKKTNVLEFFKAITRIPISYGTEVGHLWYIQMSIGLDLFFPIISPWIASSNREGFLYYLVLWAFSLFYPYIHLYYPNIFGECFWNNIHTFYYFTGYVGYAVLGQYLRRFHSEKGKWDALVGFLCLFSGGLVTMWIFFERLKTVATIPELELSWGFPTINVAVMSLGYFLLFKNITVRCPNWLKKVIAKFSEMSYGMYLAHIIVLNLFHLAFNNIIPNQGAKIMILAILSFFGVFLVVWLISFIPYSHFIIG